MKKNLHRAVALLMMVLFAAACLPLAALADEAVTRPLTSAIMPMSIEPVTENTKIDTYEFYVDGVLLNTQYIKEGDTLYEPESPSKTGHKFTGWKLEDGQTTFTAFGTVDSVTGGETIKLSAAFEQVYYVFFLDDTNRVIATKEGTKGQKISVDDVTFTVNAEHALTGWSTIQNETTPVESVTLVDQNVTLYPIIENGHWITYDSNGGTAVDPEFYTGSQTTKEPDKPTKLGYTFAGWYTDEGYNSSFTFENTLNESVTLYAKWTEVTTANYTVIFWKQKVTDAVNATEEDRTYDYWKQETREGTVGSTVSATYNDKNLSETGFKYGRSTSVDVTADGHAVLNVYYDREVVTYYFYKSSDTGDGIFLTLTGLYEAELTWPTTFPENTGGNSGPGGGNGGPGGGNSGPGGGNSGSSQDEDYDSWYYVNSNDTKVTMTFLERFTLTGTVSFFPQTKNNDKTIQFYKESLDGNWILANEQKGSGSNFNLSEKYIGFSLYQYSKDGSYYSSTNNVSKIENYNNLYLRYKRNHYNLSFYNGNSDYYEGTPKVFADKSVSVLYEEPLSEYNYSDNVPKPANLPPYYTFGGWYADPDCSSKFDFSGTMPAANVSVYAKWVAPNFTVSFNLNGGTAADESGEIASQLLKAGEQAKQPDNPIRDGYVFAGWTCKGRPFSFATTVTEDITLVAQWIGEGSYTVTYDVNGDTGLVTDEKKYADDSYADVASAEGVIPPEGRVFLCWNTKADGSGTSYYPNGKILMTSDVTLYAQYGESPKTTTLTYHTNFETDERTYEVPNIQNNKRVTILAFNEAFKETSIPEGYEFVGWNTKADGSGVPYTPKAEIVVDCKGSNDLYAVWKRKTGDIKIVKVLEDPTDDEVTFTFEISIDKDVKGSEFVAWINEHMDMLADSSTEGSIYAKVQIKVDEKDGLKQGSIVIKDLPAGMYKIHEETLPGYTTTYQISGGNECDYNNEYISVSTGGEITFTNTRKMYTLTVKKEISGNMAYTEDEFGFTAQIVDEQGDPVGLVFAGENGYTVSTDGTASFTLKGGGSVTLQGVPYGYCVKVTETGTNGYTASYSENGKYIENETTVVGPITYENASITFKNTRNVTIDTGVSLDFLPYVLLLAVAGGVIVLLLVMKRRRGMDD